MATQLAASTLLAVAAPAAWAAGPSTPLDSVPSVPVSSPSWRGIESDQASANALSGNQPAKPAQEGAGTATATSLSPSASWAVSPHTGDFTWSYPLRVPPAAGGLAPSLALSYRSSAVDGRTTVTNNQPSWIGDGWALSSGFVERTYGGCSADTEGNVKPPQVGDLCWRSDNATAAYGGAGGMLIRDDATGKWRSRADDGSRIERLTGTNNGDNDGESWKITTVDGTQHFFGSETGSTWTVPVFGDDAGEPCHGASFAASSCTQAYRWNLSRVVDRNGNEMRFYYTTDTNSYGFNGKDNAVSYVRGGQLDRIDYGLRDGVTQPSGRVVFTTADRCVPGSDCRPEKRDNWPDVPWEGKCDTATCAGNHSPTFWTTKRLASVTTKVWRGTEFGDVDRWELDQQYPDPGDGEKAALWLKGIKHTGLAGATAVEMPSVTFHGTPMYNRVEMPQDGASPLMRYRVTGIVSETGGITSITYESECKPGNMPANPETNTKRCFPVRWAKKNFAERTDYFHKYVVTAVTRSDRLTVDGQPRSTFPEEVTRYEYLDGAAWHWDTSEFTKDDKRTWNEFRGFGRVRVRNGTPDDPAGPVTMSEQRFYRGMDGDHQPSGKRQVSVTDSEGGARTDSDWLAGFGFENATFEREGPSNQPDPPRLSKTITEPAVQGPTATRGAFKAYLVSTGVSVGYTALTSGWRKTRTETTYDDLGLATKVNDLGDPGTPADDRCTHTEYARNADAWLMSLPGRVWTDSVHCGAVPEYPRDALSDNKATYDARGNVVKSELAKERPASGPVYFTAETAAHDAHGRVTSATDALGRATKTAYTPVVGGPVTKTAVTGPGTDAVPAGLVTTTTYDPAWGLPTLFSDANSRKTETQYDALGRAIAVWTPTWTKANHPQVPAKRMTYLVRSDRPTVMTTTGIGPTGAEITGNTLYDGLLRPRQLQASAQGGGRLLTDTRYDSQGRAWKTTQPYFNDKAVDTDLWIASDADIPGHTRTHYDGAGRADASIYFAGAFEKRRTTTAYFGDHVDVTPPAGGVPTSTYTDVRGQTVELRQHHAGGFDSTKYTYNKAGLAETMTDPSGAVWRFGYDFLGRQVSSDDPDSGLITRTYDDAGHVLTSRDARGVVLAYSYDALGRKTAKYAGAVGGKKLAEWTYDTVAKGKGQPASSTAFVDGNAYTGKVLSYDPAYRPTRTTMVVPASEGLLAGTYDSYLGYNPDGSVSSQSYPAAGELPEETVSFGYDDLGSLTSSWGGYDGTTVELVSATDFTRYGEMARLTLGTGTKRVWLSQYYDQNDRRPTRSVVDAEVPSPMQSDVRYGYDPAGNITSIADTFTGDVQCFRIDGLQRVTEAWTPASACDADPSVAGLRGPAPYWQSFTYDKAGNRATETRHAATGDVVRTYTGKVPGHAHALGSVSGPDGVTSYAYTAAGQLASRTSGGVAETFTWNEEGKLASVAKGDKATSFVYDPSGSRLIRRDPTGTTLYLAGQELRLPAAGGNPTVTRYYAHGGRTIAMREGRGALTWLASDHQSTAQTAVNSGTLAVTKRRQLPFGGPRGAASAFPGERGFVGGTQDASTGLTHLGAREYDPDIGRFISVDPVLDSGDPQQLNGYTYSNNNPITKSDPSGLLAIGLLDNGCPLETGCGGGKNNASAPPPSAYNPFSTPPMRQDRRVYSEIGKAPGKPARISATDVKVWRAELSNSQEKVMRCGQGLQSNLFADPACRRADEQLKTGLKTVDRIRPNRPSIDLVAGVLMLREANEKQIDDWLAAANLPGRDGLGGITISICAGAEAFMGAGAAGEVCIARDSIGYGWSASTKVGFGPRVGYGYGFSIKVSEGTIKDLGGTGAWVSTGFGSSPASMEIGRSSDGKYSLSAGISGGKEIDTAFPVATGRDWAVSGYFRDIDLSGLFPPEHSSAYRLRTSWK